MGISTFVLLALVGCPHSQWVLREDLGNQYINEWKSYWLARAAVIKYRRCVAWTGISYLVVLEAGGPRSTCQQTWFSLRPLSWACRWSLAFLLRLHVAFLCARASPAFTKTPALSDEGPTLTTQFNFTTALKALFPGTVSLTRANVYSTVFLPV